MQKVIWIIGIVLLIASGCSTKEPTQIDNGDKEVNRENEKLEGIWIQVGSEYPYTLDISDTQIIIKDEKEEILTVMNYEIKEDDKIKVHDQYQYIQFHTQEVGGNTISILSCYLLELDGRGLFVVDEFVKEEDYKKVPKDFMSKLKEESQNQEASNTIISIDEKVYVQNGDIDLVIKLNDTDVAQSLYAQLPIDVEFENYSNNEKIFTPPSPLSGEDGMEVDCPAGSVAYFSPWGNIVLYYGDAEKYNGLYPIGEVVQGVENIEKLQGKAHLERLE